MRRNIIPFFVVVILLAGTTRLGAQEKWYEIYKQGVSLLNAGDYNSAIVKLQTALQEKDEDQERIRTYGMHFIEYYPNRELGIAYYYLGNLDKAEQYLSISQNQAYSERAEAFLQKTKTQKASPVVVKKEDNPNQIKRVQKPASQIPVIKIPVTTKAEVPVTDPRPAVKISDKKTIRRVGDRMTIAVFPFESKQDNNSLGTTVMDKLTTALFNQDRFRVIERSQLERVLEEQKLGLTGILDASQAARLGRGIGVDAIIIGSATEDDKGEVSISARAIDTESGIIVVAEDGYSPSSDVQMVKNAIGSLASKFVQNIPLVQGIVISVDNSTIMIDKGRADKLRKGMKCVVYKEGKEIRHPVTNKVLGKEVIIIGEVLLTEISDLYSIAKVVKVEPGQAMSVENLFVTK